MDKFYSDIIIEVLGVTTYNGIGNLFSSDKYISKCISKYTRKTKNKINMAYNNIYFMKHKYSQLVYYYCFNDSLKDGNLRIMKWLHNNKRSFGTYAFDKAIQNNNMEAMKWLKDNGCRFSDYTCDAAIKLGNLEIMKWLKDNGCKFNIHTYDTATKHGNSEIINWLYDNGWKFDYYGYY